MLKKISIVTTLVLALTFSGYFFYKYYLSLTSKTNEITYNPFENLTLPSAEISEKVCTDFETKEFAFYLDQPTDFKQNNKFGTKIFFI